MAKDILKEAIADAKAVREVALANAKAALEEAFTPKLQSMLSAKLSQTLDEAEEEEEVDLDEMLDLDEIDDEIPSSTEPTDPSGEDRERHGDLEEDLDEEIDLEEILSELELDEDNSEEEEMDQMVATLSTESHNKGACKSCNEEKDFDLDKLLEEINNLEEKGLKHFTNHPWTRSGEVTPTTSRPEDDPNYSDLEEGMMDLTQLVSILLPLIGIPAGMFAAAGGKDALKAKMKGKNGKEKLKAFTEFLGDMSGTTAPGGFNEAELEAELEESKTALKTVKAELNEVNLLNSKLLYVNRIFKANQLDEVQKLRVVETLDNATNVKEAKLIYETIKDTFNVAKSTKKTAPKKSIREGLGMASKAIGLSTAPKRPVLNESNDMVARMQKLANIKINQ